ncbi:hypothetical protein EDD66_1206 [Mobilisporobacter senegalensis]|uniref:Uncharacterized protein n=1 Tax=Mobilisporobacter senegalensis TaxID=1329262 RepID=A0A3N1X733_9FIRM|nr:hypothetical protein [Mobilisporobacter senegalensis]ROR21758.1 hypothetical protein EDD66_1206 [Mobilisporobacter senegalensis]
MKQNKREYNPKASLSLRMVAGAYLLYIVFSLIKEFGKLEEKDILFNIIFIIIFSIAGVVILVTSTISWMKLSKEEKNGSSQESNEQESKDENSLTDENENSSNVEDEKNDKSDGQDV